MSLFKYTTRFQNQDNGVALMLQAQTTNTANQILAARFWQKKK